jgi:two-component system, NtrC family, sensor kinase
MKVIRSLHAKIVLGYCVVGGLFIALVVNALFQFRFLERELTKRQNVAVFYDAVRDARRLEKNFLLYKKTADLNEAAQQANIALATFARIPFGTLLGNNGDSGLESVALYPRLLAKLLDSPKNQLPSPELLRETYAAGSALLKLGERLDIAAQDKVKQAVEQHDADLLNTIWVALALATMSGVVVTRSVVRPLRKIEQDLKKVATGEVERVDGREAGTEVESLTRSINDTLQELELRQTTVARSSRLMALGTMLSGVAHELNNPLSNISSSCQILEEEWNELPDQQVQQLLLQIDSQVLRAQHIVATLLDFSGSRALQRNRQNVRELVEESLALLGSQISPEMRVILEIDEVTWIDADRLRFQQVLVNMIRNSAEATHSAGTIRIEARRDEFPEGTGTTLEIEDDGEGIATEHLKRVFDPFYTTKAVGKGTGLGLFVAHEIIVQHGGAVFVESQFGHGAKFWIHIPDGSEALEEDA